MPDIHSTYSTEIIVLWQCWNKYRKLSRFSLQPFIKLINLILFCNLRDRRKNACLCLREVGLRHARHPPCWVCRFGLFRGLSPEWKRWNHPLFPLAWLLDRCWTWSFTLMLIRWIREGELRQWDHLSRCIKIDTFSCLECKGFLPVHSLLIHMATSPCCWRVLCFNASSRDIDSVTTSPSPVRWAPNHSLQDAKITLLGFPTCLGMHVARYIVLNFSSSDLADANRCSVTLFGLLGHWFMVGQPRYGRMEFDQTVP